MDNLLPTYYETPAGMYPVHIFHPNFDHMQLWFPAIDALVLEAICVQAKKRLGKSALRIMEIGTYAGCSTTILSRHASYILCVDTWDGSGKPGDEMRECYDKQMEEGRSPFVVFLSNCELMPCKPDFIIRHRSPEVFERQLKANYITDFDLVFIDGAHDYDSVKEDLRIAEMVTQQGATICGHDLGQFTGVTDATLEHGFDAACCTMWWKVKK